MYDKVKIWVDRASVGDDCLRLAYALDEPKEQVDLSTGEVKAFGGLSGLKVSVYVGGVSIIGSLPKFLYGSNVYPLTRHSIKEAQEKIEDLLHIGIGNAKVTGIEFGTTFPMREQVGNYLSKLGDMPHMTRSYHKKGTLYYMGRGKVDNKTYCFYDKKADMSVKGDIVPDGLKDANLLRYEIRMDGRLSKRLHLPNVNVDLLSDEAFYSSMVARYQEAYFSINKVKRLKMDAISKIKSPKDAVNVFFAQLISKNDGGSIEEFVESMKREGVFEDKKAYTRLKKMLLDVAQQGELTENDEGVKELDDCIKNVGAYI